MDLSFVPPVFFKAQDVNDFRSLNEFEVYTCVKEAIGENNVTGCQRIGGLWRVYVKTTQCRIKLIANKLTIRNQLVGIFNDNPFRSGVQSSDDKVTKITIKDIPLSQDNKTIEAFLLSKGVTLTSPIQYGKIRNPTTKELTECFSGDRIIYSKPFSQDIPRVVYIGSSRARVFYEGQVLMKMDMLCTNCFSTDHYRSKCQNPTACKRCRMTGHQDGDSKCDAPKQSAHKKVTVFQGKDDVLSNHYPCEFKCHGILAKSSEHAYNYAKAIRKGCPELAANIKDAPTAALAYNIAKRLPYDEKWDGEKVEVMKDILLEKCKQVPEFRQALTETKSNKIVEAVPGQFFWGSGLNKTDTLFTKTKFWFGKNMMSQLLMELRDSVLDNSSHKSWPGQF